MSTTPKLIWLDPLALRTPKHVLRTINANKSKDYAAILRDAYGVPPGKDIPVSIAAHTAVWPFTRDTIQVRALPKLDVGADVTGKRHEAPQLYEIIDGNHRVRGAIEVKLPKVPCELVTPKDDAEAYMMQMRANWANGIPLTKDERDQAIRTAAITYHIKQALLCKQFSLAKASVSRICKPGGSTQRKTGARKKPAKRAAKKETAAAWTPQQYIKELRAMDAEFNEHADAVTAFVGEGGVRAQFSPDFGNFIVSLVRE